MRRIRELDGLRGLAAIAIVVFHYGAPGWLGRVAYAGSLAMELFFALSGYLISTIILEHATERGFLAAFYARRSLRIWPIYYLTVLAAAAVLVVRPDVGDLGALPRFLTFTQFTEFYWGGKPRALVFALNPTWSLAAEEQFYIIWPLLIWLVGRRWMFPLGLAFVAVGIGSRLYWTDWGPTLILATRCDAFAVGALLAVAMQHRDRVSARAATLGLAALIAVSLFHLAVVIPMRGGRPFWMGEGAGVESPTFASVMFASVIGLSIVRQGHPLLAPLRARWLGYIGTISYGIYLYHLPVKFLASGISGRVHLRPDLGRFLLAPLMTLALAAASWAWIERPILGLKDRFRYGGRAAGPATDRSDADQDLTTATASDAPR